MSKERKILTVSILKETPDDNWRGWDEETFYLREHLCELIKVYGIDVMKQELYETEWILNKLNQNKEDFQIDMHIQPMIPLKWNKIDIKPKEDSWVLIQSSLKNVPKYEVCIYGNGEWYVPANDDVCQDSDIVKWCYIND